MRVRSRREETCQFVFPKDWGGWWRTPELGARDENFSNLKITRGK